MPRALQLARRAQRRRALQASLAALGPALTIAGAVSLAAILADRLIGPGIEPWWLWLIIPAMALGLIAGVTLGYLRRGSELAAASQVDSALGLKDRIASALWFDSARRDDPFALLAREEGERAAETINLARALPLQFGRSWRIWPALLAAAICAGLFLPPLHLLDDRGPAPLTPEQLAAQQSAARAIEQAIERVDEPMPGQNAAPDVADLAASGSKRNLLEDIRKQLDSGKASPDEALSQAAGALDQMASESRAAAEDLQSQSDAAKVALRSIPSAGEVGAPGARADNLAPSGAELSNALRNGDFKAAESALEELREQIAALPTDDRKQTADDLESLAEALGDAAKTAEQRAQEVADQESRRLQEQGLAESDAEELTRSAQSQQELERALRERGLDPDAARRLAERLTEQKRQREAQRQAAEDARRLAEAARQASEDVRNPPPEPPAPPKPTPESDQPQQPSDSSRDPAQQERDPSKTDPSQQQDQQSQDQQNQREQGAEQQSPGSQRAPQDPSSQQPGQQQQQQKQPGSTPDGEPDPNNPQQGQPQKQPGANPDARQQDQQQSQPNGEQTPDGAQPQQPNAPDPSKTPTPDQKQGQAPSPDQQQKPSQQQQQQQQQSQGQQPPDGAQQQQQQQRGDQPPDNKSLPDITPPDMTPPDLSPRGLEAMKEALKRMQERDRQAQRESERSRELERQAREMLEKMSPEERERLQRWAAENMRESGKPRPSSQQPPPSDQQPGGNEQAQNIPGQPSPGDQSQSRGADDKPGSSRRPIGTTQPREGDRPTTTTPVDIRRAGDNPRVAGEWTRKDDPNNPAAPNDRAISTREMEDLLRDAQESADQAVEDQVIPARYRNVAEYFRKAVERAEKARDAEKAPPPPPAPAAKDVETKKP